MAALRQVGASVQLIHTLGGGVPDLLVGFRCQNYLLEVKDGAKSPGARKLTPAEVEWLSTWRGHVAVVCSSADALAVLGVQDAQTLGAPGRA